MTEPLPPGPSEAEGNALIDQVKQGKRSLRQLVGEMFATHGPVCRLGGYVLLYGPEAHQFALLARPEDIQRGPIAEAGPRTLACMDGETHRQHRKIVLQAFTPRRLEGYLPIIGGLLEGHTRDWGGERELRQEYEELALAFIGATMLGLSPTTPEYTDVFVPNYHLMYARGRPSEEPGSSWQKALAARDKLWALFDELCARRRAEPGPDAISALLAASEGGATALSQEELRTYIYMLAEFGQGDLAGFLTMASACAAASPALLDRLAEESRAAPEPLTAAAAGQLVWHNAFLKEVERLYPPVPFLFRKVMRDLSFRGWRLPASSQLILSIYHTHRMPEHFRDPAVFRPERLVGDGAEGRTPYTLLGFGAGPHICAAKAYAEVVLAYAWAHLTRRFRFAGAVEPDQVYDTHAPLPLRVERRG
jgi:cytochrome P450